MNQRSQLIARMARRESSKVAQARRELSLQIRELQAAEQLLDRLNGLLSQKREQASQAASVAQLRERRHLTDQLSAEAERNRVRVDKLRSETALATEALSRLDHRKRTFDEAAATARMAELAERETRAEAAFPARARR